LIGFTRQAHRQIVAMIHEAIPCLKIAFERIRIYQRTPTGKIQPTCLKLISERTGSMSVVQEDVKTYNEKESSQTAGWPLHRILDISLIFQGRACQAVSCASMRKNALWFFWLCENRIDMSVIRPQLRREEWNQLFRQLY